MRFPALLRPPPFFILFGLGLVFLACPPARILGQESVKITAYNVRNYLVTDRWENDRHVSSAPKPENEIKAVVASVAEIRPDILAVSEMGDETFFKDFTGRLNSAGLDFPFTEHLVGFDRTRSLALASRYPITARNSQPNLPYTLNGAALAVQRGILDVTVTVRPGYDLRVLTVHLKSKRKTPEGDEEMMRRMEARTVRDYVDAILAKDPQTRLVLLGDCNDTRESPTIGELQGPKKSPAYMKDIQVADANGERWTHYWITADSYTRIDYMFVSPALWPEVDGGKSFIYTRPDWFLASDHRPVVGVFNLPAKK